MSNHASNPAGRLLLYFQNIATNPVAQPVQRYAAAYFGLPPGFTHTYLSAMAALMQLPDEVETRVRQIDDPPLPADKLLQPLDAVRTVLNADPLGEQSVGWVTQTVTPQVLSELDSTSHILNRYALNDPALGDDTLSKIRRLADEIIALANDDERLEADARRAFLRYAHRIAEAADLYKVAGARPLLDELDRFTQESRRMEIRPGTALLKTTKQLTATIVLAVELFMVPVNIDNALEYYGELLAPPAITEAPAVRDQEIVVAEIESEEPA